MALFLVSGGCGRINFDLQRPTAPDGGSVGDAADDGAIVDGGDSGSVDGGASGFCSADATVCFVEETQVNLSAGTELLSMALFDNGWLAVGINRTSDNTGGVEFYNPDTNYTRSERFFNDETDTDYGFSVAACGDRALVGEPGRGTVHFWSLEPGPDWRRDGGFNTLASRNGTTVDCGPNVYLFSAADRVIFNPLAPLTPALQTLGPEADGFGAAAAVLERPAFGRIAWAAVGAPSGAGGRGETYLYGFNDFDNVPDLHTMVTGGLVDGSGTGVHLSASDPPVLDVGSATGNAVESYEVTATGTMPIATTMLSAAGGLGQSIDRVTLTSTSLLWRVFGFSGGALVAVPGDAGKQIAFRRSEAGFGTVVSGGTDRIAVAAPGANLVVIYQRL